MAGDLRTMQKDLLSMAAVLQPAGLKSVMMALGEAAKVDMLKAASADLGGDAMFSGWPKAPLTADYKLVSPTRIEYTPGRRSYGPWKVATEGRKAYKVGDTRSSGRRSKKTGALYRGRTMKRNVGATAGNGTFDDAVVMVNAELPQKAFDLLTAKLERARGG